ncbi:hypothetical protein C9974_15730 [Marinobacter sp. B9-2]|nr:hypothetical protein C9974_15730 [Marinobacter sp. B9-2]
MAILSFATSALPSLPSTTVSIDLATGESTKPLTEPKASVATGESEMLPNTTEANMATGELIIAVITHKTCGLFRPRVYVKYTQYVKCTIAVNGGGRRH